MVVTTHQPIFLPWPGFFFKGLQADYMVLLDDVQFPRGRGWMNRNRLKNEQGELWLTVPVWKKGRELQIIRDVEICDETDWRKKHLRSIRQNYANAPYLEDHFSTIESIYRKDHRFLIQLNMELIRFLWAALNIKTELLLQSDLGIKDKGTDLLVRICQHLSADAYLTFPIVEKYLEPDKFSAAGIRLRFSNFHPPVYPQLWSAFIYNLSTLDLLLNCGPKSKDLIIA
ncbi:WbqC family protein [candidate division KSB1 bacterium]|nr:WbqC family protein [candidate division KSB1 bacterium]NIR69543.1 WbqC family protein [candidate division KSB1 bacterium]NIS22853.1 WbqC family protein [candidate division KSB1 bacterium]NIT69690.1 WbqC family protein [candidate division KSB1 bacterium]NIU23359.1 WbqC family protein [candidate division KSB1 bacterium]